MIAIVYPNTHDINYSLVATSSSVIQEAAELLLSTIS
jgi:hypothetical protein